MRGGNMKWWQKLLSPVMAAIARLIGINKAT